MIYTFNLMVELEPNGVDVAQAYRGQIFRKLGCPARFVFTQVPPRYKWITICLWDMLKMKSF